MSSTVRTTPTTLLAWTSTISTTNKQVTTMYPTVVSSLMTSSAMLTRGNHAETSSSKFLSMIGIRLIYMLSVGFGKDFININDKNHIDEVYIYRDSYDNNTVSNQSFNNLELNC
jgi:hypothetical protein